MILYGITSNYQRRRRIGFSIIGMAENSFDYTFVASKSDIHDISRALIYCSRIELKKFNKNLVWAGRLRMTN